MSKKKQKVAPVRQMSKRQLSRWERDKKLQRLVYAAGAALAAILIAVVAVGVYREVVLPPRETVVRVNDRAFSMEYYVKLYSLRDYMLSLQQAFLQQSQGSSTDNVLDGMQQQLQQIQFARAMLPDQVLEEIIEDELIRQGAQAEGITVTPQEVDDHLMSQFVASPQEGEQIDPAQQRADFEQVYSSVLANTGVSDAEYRELATAEVLRKKIDQKLRDALPTVGEQVHVQVIQATTEEEATAVKEKLDQGVPFDQVAQQLSNNTAPESSPGPSPDQSADASASPSPSPPPPTGPSFIDVGWLPRGLGAAEFDEVSFALQPGQVSDAVQGPMGGFTFIKLIERQEDREISADHRSQLGAQAFQAWMDNQEQAATIERQLDSQKQSWATRQVQKMREKLGQAAG